MQGISLGGWCDILILRSGGGCLFAVVERSARHDVLVDFGALIHQLLELLLVLDVFVDAVLLGALLFNLVLHDVVGHGCTDRAIFDLFDILFVVVLFDLHVKHARHLVLLLLAGFEIAARKLLSLFVLAGLVVIARLLDRLAAGGCQLPLFRNKISDNIVLCSKLVRLMSRSLEKLSDQVATCLTWRLWLFIGVIEVQTHLLVFHRQVLQLLAHMDLLLALFVFSLACGIFVLAPLCYFECFLFGITDFSNFHFVLNGICTHILNY